MSAEDAFDTLCAAIRDYYTATDPEAYVDAWIIINHKRSPQLEKDGQSVVGVLSSPDLSWVMKRGLLDVALNDDRFSVEDADDD
jgi:hypothetical protein